MFTDGKVMFRCQAVSDWQEYLFETEAEIKGDYTRSYGTYNSSDIGEFEGLIVTYSDRVYTDVYNAFAGVFSAAIFPDADEPVLRDTSPLLRLVSSLGPSR